MTARRKAGIVAVEKRFRLSQRLRPTFENPGILVGRGVMPSRLAVQTSLFRQS